MATGDALLTTATRPVAVHAHRRQQAIGGLYYVLLGLVSIIFAFPFFWTVSSSLKDVSELFTFPPTMLPAVPQWGNYARVLEKVPFLTWVGNTLFVVLLSTTGIVLSSSLAAYAFARFQFRGRESIFLLSLATLMLPAQVTLIPQFILFHELGWINTLFPLWVPYWFGGGAFSIFLLRQFIMTLPRELDESAMIDGANPFQIFRRILLPLMKPALATVAVIAIIGRWNDFIEPLVYLNSPEKFTLAIGLSFFKNVPESGGLPMQHLLMAASVMTILPIIVLFFVAQRYFIQGIALTGLKG